MDHHECQINSISKELDNSKSSIAYNLTTIDKLKQDLSDLEYQSELADARRDIIIQNYQKSRSKRKGVSGLVGLTPMI